MGLSHWLLFSLPWKKNLKTNFNVALNLSNPVKKWPLMSLTFHLDIFKALRVVYLLSPVMQAAQVPVGSSLCSK